MSNIKAVVYLHYEDNHIENDHVNEYVEELIPSKSNLGYDITIFTGNRHITLTVPVFKGNVYSARDFTVMTSQINHGDRVNLITSYLIDNTLGKKYPIKSHLRYTLLNRKGGEIRTYLGDFKKFIGRINVYDGVENFIESNTRIGVFKFFGNDYRLRVDVPDDITINVVKEPIVEIEQQDDELIQYTGPKGDTSPIHPVLTLPEDPVEAIYTSWVNGELETIPNEYLGMYSRKGTPLVTLMMEYQIHNNTCYDDYPIDKLLLKDNTGRTAIDIIESRMKSTIAKLRNRAVEKAIKKPKV